MNSTKAQDKSLLERLQEEVRSQKSLLDLLREAAAKQPSAGTTDAPEVETRNQVRRVRNGRLVRVYGRVA